MSYDIERAREHFAARNTFTTDPWDLKARLDAGETLHVVDVRFAPDFRKGHIPGAVNLPKNRWDRVEEALSRDKLNVLYCYNQACHKASQVASIALEKGYRVVEMEGGFAAWEGGEFPVAVPAARAA